MKTARIRLGHSTLLAGAALCATLLAPAAALAQDAGEAATAERRAQQAGATTPAVDPARAGTPTDRATPETVTATSEVDLAEAPEVASLVREEALHRDRIGRIHRLREIATRTNQRERLAQLDDLERRETSRHEADVVRGRSRLSERAARGYDDIVRRNATFRARGSDVTVARKSRQGASGGEATRRGDSATPDRTAPRTSRSPTRAPTRSPSRSGGRSPR